MGFLKDICLSVNNTLVDDNVKCVCTPPLLYSAFVVFFSASYINALDDAAMLAAAFS